MRITERPAPLAERFKAAIVLTFKFKSSLDLDFCLTPVGALPFFEQGDYSMDEIHSQHTIKQLTTNNSRHIEFTIMYNIRNIFQAEKLLPPGL